MSWIFLLIAGVFEWGWPMGLKYAWRDGQFYYGPALLAGASMAVSGTFLFFAQRTIPVGTAYAVWSGIGAVGTFVLGIWLLNEPNVIARWFCASLIVAGIVGMKLVSES